FFDAWLRCDAVDKLVAAGGVGHLPAQRHHPKLVDVDVDVVTDEVMYDAAQVLAQLHRAVRVMVPEPQAARALSGGEVGRVTFELLDAPRVAPAHGDGAISQPRPSPPPLLRIEQVHGSRAGGDAQQLASHDRTSRW